MTTSSAENDIGNRYSLSISTARTIASSEVAGRTPNDAFAACVVEEDGRPWIVMELVRARSLDRVIAEAPAHLRPGGRLVFTLFGFLGVKTALGKRGTAATQRTRSGAGTARTRAELYEIAKRKDLPGRSRMGRDELARKLGLR